MKRSVQSYILWTWFLFVLCLIPRTHGLYQKIRDSRDEIDLFPGCMVQGKFSGQPSKIKTIYDVESPKECYHECMRSWTSSRYRGIHLELRKNSFSPATTTAYIGTSMQPGELLTYALKSFIQTAKDSYDWVEASNTAWKNYFYNDAMRFATVQPCYKFQAWNWDGRRKNNYADIEFSGTAVRSGNLNPKSDGTGSDVADVQVATEPLMCSMIGSDPDSELIEEAACRSWQYSQSIQACRLYPDEVISAESTSEYKFYPPTRSAFVSGNLYCANDANDMNIPDTYAEIIFSVGCAISGLGSSGTDVANFFGIDTFHDCRRLCQQEPDCIMIHFNVQRHYCRLKKSDALLSLFEPVMDTIHLGSKYCATCLAGFYITDPDSESDSCAICPVGYYCRDDLRINCPGGTRCVKSGLTDPGTAGPESQCSIGYSGVACQHPICRDSKLGINLLRYAFEEPADFDFSVYNVEDLSVTQVIAEKENAATAVIGFQIVIVTAIQSNILDYYRIEVATDGVLIGHYTQPAPTFDCSNNHNTTFISATISDQLDILQIGDTIKICVKLQWADAFVPKSWDSLNVGNNGIPWEPIYHCYFHTVSFLALLDIAVDNLDGNAPSTDVEITYTIGDDPQIFSTMTNLEGKTSLRVTDILATDEYSSITILSASKQSSSSDIRLCPFKEANTPCTKSNTVLLPQTIPLVHLRAHNLRMVDLDSRRVRGRITFPFQGIYPPCGVGGVEVRALNSLQNNVNIASAITDTEGQFSLGVLQNSKITLSFIYGDHTFEPASEDDADADALLSTGLQIKDDTDVYEFVDNTTRSLGVFAAATECEFGLGNITITLTVSACSSVTLQNTLDQPFKSLTSLPATNYSIHLSFLEDEEAQNSFEYQFPGGSPKLQIDLTKSPKSFRFVYQPVPELLGAIAEGSYVPHSGCNSNTLPFDFIVEGNRRIELEIGTIQRYESKRSGEELVCRFLPALTRLNVTSGLSPGFEFPCSTSKPCEISFLNEVIVGLSAHNQSVFRPTVVSGEPQNPISSNSDFHSNLSYFVRVVNLELINEAHWASPLSESLQLKMRMLVIGSKVLRADDVVSFPSEDAIPLYYLYAPPVTSTTADEPPSARASFKGSFSVESTMHFEVENSKTRTIQSKTLREASLNTELPFVNVNVGSSIESNHDDTQISSSLESLEDTSSIVLRETTFELRTTSEVGDMVLFLGSTANLTESITLTYDSSTCTIRSEPSLLWGEAVSSLVYYSRANCEKDLKDIEESIELHKGSSDAQEFLAQAQVGRLKWLNLLKHWDNDFLTARNYPLDLMGMGIDAPFDGNSPNRLILGGGAIDFEETSSHESKELVDFASVYDTHEYSNEYGASISATLSASLSIFGVEVSASSTLQKGANAKWTTVRTHKTENRDFENKKAEITRSTHLVNNDVLNKVCLDIFQSPHSGSHVYSVCGGITRCPHIAGTDARETFTLSVGELPAEELPKDTDKGTFSFFIDTTSQPISDDELNVIISVDAASTTGRIAYRIGSATFNQDFELTIQGRTRHLVVVYYERLDSRVQSSTVSVTVASACDENIAKSIPFRLRWAAPCPSIEWQGGLADPTSTWHLSTGTPSLEVIGISGTTSSSTSALATVWAARYKNGHIMEDWFQVLELDTDTHKATLTGKESGFVDSEKYLLEIRLECRNKDGYVQGSTRSGQRLGLVDYTGPSVTTWTPVYNVKKAVSTVPIASFEFDEQIDCSSTNLEAFITDEERGVSLQAITTCTPLLTTITVHLPLQSANEATLWNSTKVKIVMSGVMDLMGNLANTILVENSRSLQSDNIGLEMIAPVLVEYDGSKGITWNLPTAKEHAQMVNSARNQLLPIGGYTISSTFYHSTSPDGEDETPNNISNTSDNSSSAEGKKKDTSAITYAAPAAGAFCVAGIVVALYLRRYHHRLKSKRDLDQASMVANDENLRSQDSRKGDTKESTDLCRSMADSTRSPNLITENESRFSKPSQVRHSDTVPSDAEPK